jgi:uncharacterized protein (DUF924 family)
MDKEINQQITATDILDYWYCERIKKQWFNSTSTLDKEILDKYGNTWEKALTSELDDWVDEADGCLALIIILDQFPLNMYRGQAKSFKSEAKAIAISHLAIKKQFHKQIKKDRLAFLYMPLMHSENRNDQDISVKLFRESNLESNIRFAEHHREIIRKFGRFPHRNTVLGRENTDEEKNYLASKNAFLG